MYPAGVGSKLSQVSTTSVATQEPWEESSLRLIGLQSQRDGQGRFTGRNTGGGGGKHMESGIHVFTVVYVGGMTTGIDITNRPWC